MKRFLATLCILVISSPLFGDEKEGGIIGTGVVGQITGLDEFEVSGMRFNLPQNIELNGVERMDELRMGMTLVLQAAPDGNEWQATQIKRMPTLTGPKTGPGEVMGVQILGELPDADFVTVDGFWSKSGVVASHTSSSVAETQMVNGVYDATSRKVGLIRVKGNIPTDQSDGKLVTVFGEFQDGVLIVERFDTDLFVGVAPDLLLVEGYFSPPNDENEIALNGVAYSTMEAENDLDMTQRVRRCSLRGRTDFSLSELSEDEVATINSFCVSASSL
ncbi:MAG: hypothetical protein AAGF53_09185 [Pseudomonadota bacterium]